MNKKDIRYHRTQDRILQAMIELLKEKNFHKITVKNICEQAAISRSGFYLHYLDKYDLIESYQQEFMQIVNQRVKERIMKGQDAVLLEVLNALKKEGELMALLISQNEALDVQNRLIQMMQENALNNLFPYVNVSFESETEKRYFISFLSHAMLGIIQEWISSGQKESPESIVSILDKIIDFDLVE